MGDIKVEIGKRIRSARLNKGLTQIDICDDESELTIRQLARIENGQAMVTLPKIIFLSEKLGIPVQDLLDRNKIEIPNRYLELKNKLIKSHTYGDAERIRQHELMFDEIYEEFYDNLPEEEQLLVEVLQVKLDVFSSRNSEFGIRLLEEYLHQILKKKHYSYNDLLIIDLYLFCCAIDLEDKTYFEELSQKVLSYIDYSDFERMYVLEKILLSILTQIEPDQYLLYTKTFREIIETTNNFQHKPAIYAFEAKYYLQVQKDIEKATESYDKSIMFAKMLNDTVLASNLEKEKSADLGNLT
ncbi:helix-turn-helix domain-containing protein [Streptococcus sp. zg-86]|uniref:Helix-turn-helix domain-containing protein n=1 Tax=Streptococcus zhangguiae TaxID=2664091 RepID=A0A6I4R7C1_9STRE|nr:MULTISPECIES: XRE family transcriptional regulator [unclassified Streptococcus]MTB63725.1 helix-turn-helix domain-containing protein [Streptococcus sp. zg-86]MTB90035.1 helix-turn-helix domain-containing protein [Streptococcus sp. zg-36]MWV55706.1 helix-turn-helix domain-containing protein [Streptococcus sp. zg-70]QTH48003.1 helix-turn-helix domain-containing protein [Streptococcus sp. zg-86]